MNEQPLILVVDDEPEILALAREILGAAGHVEVAANGKEALAKLKTHAYDVVLTDMIMPEMSGTEVYQHLKKINPEVKVLLASGYTADEKALEILKDSHCGFIQKPFDIVHLSHKVREVIDMKI